MGMKGNLLHPPSSIAQYKTCQQVVSRCSLVFPHTTWGPHVGTSSKAATESVLRRVSHTAFLFAPNKREMESLGHPQMYGSMRNKLNPDDSLFHGNLRSGSQAPSSAQTFWLPPQAELTRHPCSMLCSPFTHCWSAQNGETPWLQADGPPSSFTPWKDVEHF